MLNLPSKLIHIAAFALLCLASCLTQSCSSTPNKDNKSISTAPVPPEVCRLKLRAERWHPSLLSDMTVHRYVYKWVKLLNYQTGEQTTINLKNGEDFDEAEVELPEGKYKITSILVQDQYASATRSVSNVPFIREVQLGLEITVKAGMLGQNGNVDFAPHKINDFTTMRYRAI